MPDLLAELAGLSGRDGMRRIHEVIQGLGGAAVSVQQEYRDALCPTHMRPGDWKSALAEAKRDARHACRAVSGAVVDDEDQDDDAGPVGDGAQVLDDVAAWIGPFLALPCEQYLSVLALWAAHTHAVGAFYVTPRLVVDSAEPESGKTRVLEPLNLVCRRPELILSPTTAALFRMLADGPMTLLFDELDAVFDPRHGGNYEDLRALLNAGYKRGATIPRCVGDAAAMKVQRFAVFAPVALAGLAGNMPATILTRAVMLHMQQTTRSADTYARSATPAARRSAPPRTTSAAPCGTPPRRSCGPSTTPLSTRNIGLHQLRHTHATELVNDGVSLQTIRKRLGHRKIQTTLGYAEHSDRAADDELRAWRRPRRR